ncbi:hypothetical protein LCGC14_1190970 [marine sediment metagenome]|uniref:Uncharacterized protein n=1 Tax=marine sediment metagenome TaxID=412755 RepID=A0A0F9M756_9ZZZZ
MKLKKYCAWIEDDGSVTAMGNYYAFNKPSALILARATAIREGLDYKLVRVRLEE